MQKINSLIQKTLSEIINTKFSERINFVSINFVHTLKDLSLTRVYVNFTRPNQNKEFVKFLKIKNLIQKEFGYIIKLKKTPKINFILDKNQEKITRVEKILDKISKQNEN